MNTETRKAMIIKSFEEQFGQAPEMWARAPGRVDLMGSHTDYNLGYVMTMTIDRDIWIAASPRTDNRVEIYSQNLDGGGTFDLDNLVHDQQSPWTNYVRGMAKMLQNAGHKLVGFNGLIHSTIPFGSGLSSSAAIEMAAAEIFQLSSDFNLDPVEKALLGQQAENRFVGVNSGILDQYSSAMGREGCALLLDCRDLTSRTIAIANDLRVVICDTRAERNLSGTEYDDRRAQCEEGVRLLQQWYPTVRALRDVSLEQFEVHEADLPPIIARRCRFIIEENQRVLELADTLPIGDPDRLHKLLAESYAGARDLYEIGAPAMEAMMEVMLSGPGVIGARQAGAGFGGCMVSLVEESQVDAFAQHVVHAYQESTGVEPYIYSVMPAAGSGPMYE